MPDKVAESSEKSLTPQQTEIERLRKEKRVVKTQLSKLYTKLLRLVADESSDLEKLIEGLETYEEKQASVLSIIEELAIEYKRVGDDRGCC